MPPRLVAIKGANVTPKLIDCMFCVSTQVPSSGEDVFPIWLQKKLRYVAELHHPGILPRYVTYTYDNFATFRNDALIGFPEQPGRNVLGARPAVYKLPEVCKECNGGWMSRLEAVAQLVIPGLIEGKSKRLAAFDQLILSTWMAKTSLTFDAACEPRLIPGHLGSEVFYRTGYPLFPSDVVISHDADHVPEGSLAFAKRAVSSRVLPPGVQCVVVQFQFDHLILRTTINFGENVPEEGQLGASPDDLRHSTRIWPTQQAFVWPSPDALLSRRDSPPDVAGSTRESEQ